MIAHFFMVYVGLKIEIQKAWVPEKTSPMNCPHEIGDSAFLTQDEYGS